MFDWRGDTKAGAPTADVKSPAAVQSVDWITNRVLFRSGSGTDASTSVSFFSAAIGTPGTRIHPLDHVYTVLELMRPPSPLISINVSAKMPPIGKPRLSDALASKYTSNRSSPVRLGRTLLPPPLPFPEPGGSGQFRCGTLPSSNAPATRTWKNAVEFEVAAPYRTMSRSAFFTRTGSESAWSLPIQSAKSPSTRTVEGGATTYARIGPPRITTGTGAVASVTSIWTTLPGEIPVAKTDAVIVASGWPWVRLTEPVDKVTVNPGVALQTNEDTLHEAPADSPRACTRIVNHEVVVALTTDARGSNSTSTEPSGVSGARLRLETPAKSSAKTAMRKFVGSNPVRSYVET